MESATTRGDFQPSFERFDRLELGESVHQHLGLASRNICVNTRIVPFKPGVNFQANKTAIIRVSSMPSPQEAERIHQLSFLPARTFASSDCPIRVRVQNSVSELSKRG